MKKLVFAFIALVSLYTSIHAQYSVSMVNDVSRIINKNPKSSPDKLAGLIASSLGQEASKKSQEAVGQVIKARKSHRSSLKALPRAHRIYDHFITSMVSRESGAPAEWCAENRTRFEFSLGLISKKIKELTECISQNTTGDLVGMLDNVLLDPSRLSGNGDYSQQFKGCEDEITYLSGMIDFIGDFNSLCN